MNRQAILKFEASLLFNTLQILHTHTQTHIERERERGGGGQKKKADLFSEKAKAKKNVFCLSGGDV